MVMGDCTREWSHSTHLPAVLPVAGCVVCTAAQLCSVGREEDDAPADRRPPQWWYSVNERCTQYTHPLCCPLRIGSGVIRRDCGVSGARSTTRRQCIILTIRVIRCMRYKVGHPWPMGLVVLLQLRSSLVCHITHVAWCESQQGWTVRVAPAARAPHYAKCSSYVVCGTRRDLGVAFGCVWDLSRQAYVVMAFALVAVRPCCGLRHCWTMRSRQVVP